MNKFFKNPKSVKVLQWLVLVILVGILAYALWDITTDLATINSAGLHPTRHYYRAGIPGQLSTGQIQGWMTFRYLNQVFHLPPEYLKQNLGISDSHYPNLSIGALAKEGKTSSQAELLLVQQAIKSYAITGGAEAP